MSVGRYQQYFFQIAASRKKLESFVSEIKKMGEHLSLASVALHEYHPHRVVGARRPRGIAAKRWNLAHLALNFACSHSTGLYASEAIEQVFLELAQEHQIFGEISLRREGQTAQPSQIQPFEKNSVLHVATKTYLVGGHTRVLERWIAQAEPGEKHSLVLLNQKDPDQIPPKLRDLIQDQAGKFLVYDHHESLLERALKLRRLGQTHEYVILHIHPNDPIPLLAFGVEEFTRPVILFNHADHAFWCGVAIADLVLELSLAGRERSLTRRGVARSEVLGIPVDSTLLDTCRNREQARARLGWPADQKVVLVVGSSTKFRHIGGDGLAETLLKIIQAGEPLSPDPAEPPEPRGRIDGEKPPLGVGVLAIGPDPSEPAWARAVAESGGRLRLSPPVDYDKEYLDYLYAADLMLDSYPVPGGTAVIDAVLAGRPVLSLKTAWPQSDFLMASESYCRSEEELLTKANKILRNESYARKIAAETLAQMERRHSVENWKRRRREILDQLPSRHRINRFFSPESQFDVTDSDVLIGAWMDPYFFRKSKLRAFRHFFYQKYKVDDCCYVKILGRDRLLKSNLLR